MQLKRFLTAGPVLIGLVLAGCTASAGGSANRPADCGAAALASKVGQPVTGRTAADVRVGGEPVQSLGNVRVVAPGEAVTMDYNVERLTIHTDASGNLVRAQCT